MFTEKKYIAMPKWLENETKLELIFLLTFYLTAVKWSVTDLGGFAAQSIFKHCHVLERLLLLTAGEPGTPLKSCFFVSTKGKERTGDLAEPFGIPAAALCLWPPYGREKTAL